MGTKVFRKMFYDETQSNPRNLTGQTQKDIFASCKAGTLVINGRESTELQQFELKDSAE